MYFRLTIDRISTLARDRSLSRHAYLPGGELILDAEHPKPSRRVVFARGFNLRLDSVAPEEHCRPSMPKVRRFSQTQSRDLYRETLFSPFGFVFFPRARAAGGLLIHVESSSLGLGGAFLVTSDPPAPPPSLALPLFPSLLSFTSLPSSPVLPSFLVLSSSALPPSLALSSLLALPFPLALSSPPTFLPSPALSLLPPLPLSLSLAFSRGTVSIVRC